MIRRSADFGAFESENRDDDGGETEQQRDDHQSSAGLQVNRKSQDRLEAAALDGTERRGGTAHPQTFKRPLAAAHRLGLTPHLPHLGGGAAGLEAPGDHAQNQTYHLEGHRHAAGWTHTHLEIPGRTRRPEEHLKAPGDAWRLSAKILRFLLVLVLHSASDLNSWVVSGPLRFVAAAFQGR